MTTIDEKRLTKLKELLRPIRHDERYDARMAGIYRDIRALFASMAKAERRCLAPEVLRWHKLAQSLPPSTKGADVEQLEVRLTSVAFAATASWSELQKDRWWGAAPASVEMLADRGVAWLAEAVELVLERTTSSFAIGSLAHGINLLVAAGRIQMPSHDHYAIGIAYGYTFSDEDTSLVERVRRDLTRIESAICRQFEVEGGGEISLANFDKYMPTKSGGGWADVLITLADEGHLDRQRLLDASLDALNRGFGQFRAGWFSRFHEQLAPTPEERAARVQNYLDLLASPIGPTVSMAIAALRQLQKAERLDARIVVERIEPALYAKTAATAKEALALLAQATMSQPGLALGAARVAAAGLEHPKSEVQSAALALIESCGAAAISGARDVIAPRFDVVSAALRDRATKLLGNTPLPVTALPPTPANDLVTPTGELVAAAQSLPSQLRRLAGIDAALAALEDGTSDIPRAVFTGMDIPRLDPAKTIAPIATFEDLIDGALAVIEHADDLDRVERVLAGALHFAADRPTCSDVLLGPLSKSLKRYRVRSHDGSCWASPRGALQIVLSALTHGQASEFTVPNEDPRALMVLRTAAMANAICARDPRIQLSTPTHAGCWINPGTLVERSLAASKRGAAPMLGLADQILALLRLAPDRREQALKMAKPITGEWGAALRYALGGDETIKAARVLWVAAARSRAPFDADPRLAKAFGPGGRGADLPLLLLPRVTPVRFNENATGFRISIATEADGGIAGDFGKECIGTTPDITQGRRASAETCVTTADLANPTRIGALDTYQHGGMFHTTTWAPAIWPQQPEPVFALAAKAACMLDGNNYFRPANEPLAEGLKLILDPDVPLGPMALFMLCRGLNALDRAAAQATVDALIAVIDDGRLDGKTLGGAMHQFLKSGLAFGKRWPDRLMDVARSSPLALQVIRRALECALQPLKTEHKLRDIHAWIERLLELSIELGEAIEDPATRTALAESYATGKAKPIAARLLALKPSGTSRTRAEAAVHALERRLARARRWHEFKR